VQKLDEFEGAGANLRHGRGLLDRIEIVAHKVDAATLWRHHIIEAGEVAREQGLGGGAVGVEAVICHRLSATCLVARVDDLMAEALQKFEGRDPNFREEGVDETGDEQANAHVAPLQRNFDRHRRRPARQDRGTAACPQIRPLMMSWQRWWLKGTSSRSTRDRGHF
jgi:hypothetical protein